MTVALIFRAVAQQSSSVCAGNGLRRMSPWRSYSSAASSINETLPLAGVRVLDMTRVLAGVSRGPLFLILEYELTPLIAQPYCTQILGDLGYVQLEALRAMGKTCMR